MESIILIAVGVLGGIALCCALLIWGVSKIIHAGDESHIEDILAVLPGSNCGLCGYPSCRQFALAIDKRHTTEEQLFCLSGGKRVAGLLSALLNDPALAKIPTAGERKQQIEKFRAARKK
jgi:Na+-translocating ferredoxin:NAD+ oxidoreductase RNF subunit RnfB